MPVAWTLRLHKIQSMDTQVEIQVRLTFSIAYLFLFYNNVAKLCRRYRGLLHQIQSEWCCKTIRYEATQIISVGIKLVTLYCLFRELDGKLLHLEEKNKQTKITSYYFCLSPEKLSSLVSRAVDSTSFHPLRNATDIHSIHTDSQLYY